MSQQWVLWREGSSNTEHCKTIGNFMNKLLSFGGNCLINLFLKIEKNDSDLESLNATKNVYSGIPQLTMESRYYVISAIKSS